MTDSEPISPGEPSTGAGEEDARGGPCVPNSPMASRVVEVCCDLGKGKRKRWRYGSGAVIAGRTVLTSAHVVKDAAAVFVRTPGKIKYTAVIDPEFVGDPEGKIAPDLALVFVPDWPNLVSPIPIAGIDREEPTSITEAHAIGYPRFADHSDGMIRETVHATGEIPTLSGMVNGLGHLHVKYVPRPLPPPTIGAIAATPWAGMSGAPVLAGGYLIGVVAIHAPREGQSTLTFTPLTALDPELGRPGWGDGVPHPTRWWERLGQSIPELKDRPQLVLLPRRTSDKPPVRPLVAWNPERLGIHKSIASLDSALGFLSPYIIRPHDHDLERHLTGCQPYESRPKLIIVTGNSCTGKTRSIYEAARKILGDWPTIDARTPIDVINSVDHRIAGRKLVIWLDELQSCLPSTEDGEKAADALRKLIDQPAAGQIAILGTIWPHQYKERIASRHTSKNGSQVADLLRDERIVWVEVPDDFTDEELETADRSDPRISLAIETAHSGQITQVLAGGPQLVTRMYPTTPEQRALAFLPAVRAVIQAAAELRRIGHPNPIPAWAIMDGAPSYLTPEALTYLPENWLTNAMAEAVQETGNANPIAPSTYTHDVHMMGVPALSRETLAREAGNESYHLHDFLLQDHLARYKYRPVSHILWDSLLSNGRRIGPVILTELADNAADRGMTTVACRLLSQAFEDYGYLAAHMKLLNLLKERYHRGDKFAERYYWRIVPDKKRRSGSSTWDRYSTWGTLEDFASFGMAMFRSGPPAGRDGYFIQAASHFAREGDESALSDLRAYAERYVYAEVNFASTLQLLAENGDERALSELRQLALRGKYHAQSYLADVLDKRAKKGDETAETELQKRADMGEHASQLRYARILGQRALSGDGDALSAMRSRVHALEFGASDELVRVYRAQNPDLTVIGLDFRAGPEFASRTFSQRLGRFLSSMWQRSRSR